MELQEFLSKEYQGKDAFLDNIIFPIFGEVSWNDSYDLPLLEGDPDLMLLADRTGVTGLIEYGYISKGLLDLHVYEVTVRSSVVMKQNRVGIQQIIHRVMGSYSSSFIIFRYDDNDNWDWRFSYCQKDDKIITESKRYTFLLGPSQRCRTAAENFKKLIDLNHNVTRDDIIKAFDVEALSKEFFKKYKNHYGKFVGYIIGKNYNEAKDIWEDKDGLQPDSLFAEFDNNEKTARNYVKKMMGRIAFLYFLQKKGWAPDLLKAFDSHQDLQENFLDAYLEPLFGGILNTPKGDNNEERKKIFAENASRGWNPALIDEFNDVPYLNGGLFETDKEDPPKSVFPKEYFKSLFTFLSQYNFTIDENDPNDAEIGVDPEMLGHIFENLLEDNKDKGAFYTPKEIVKYMCKESLIAYLQTDAKDEAHKNRLRNFVETHDASVLQDVPFVLNKIKNVKICDPAIGSGAFPMGLLNELVACTLALNPAEKRFEAKKHIIQNSIYGVDIESGAVEIARLRFWLSLVVDEEEPCPLPNLDYKIMQGNSLLEQFEGIDLSKPFIEPEIIEGAQVKLVFGDETTAKEILYNYIEQYYYEQNHEKKIELKQKINSQVRNVIHSMNLEKSIVDKFDKIDLDDNSDFFLWHIYFSDVFNHISNPAIEKLNLEIKSINAQIDLINYSLAVDDSQKIIKIHVLTALEQAEVIGDQLKYIKKHIDEMYGEISSKVSSNIAREPESLDFEISVLNSKIKKINNQIAEISKKIPAGRRVSGGFDIVIGNPPYIDSEVMSKVMPEKRNLYSKIYSTAKGNWDLFIVFIELAIGLLKPNGVFSNIIPNKLIAAKYALTLRQLLSSKSIIEIRDYSRIDVFESASVYPITITLCNNSLNRNVKFTLMADIKKTKQINCINNSELAKTDYWDVFFTNPLVCEMVLKMNQMHRLSSLGVDVFGAATVSDAYEIKKYITEFSDIDCFKFVNSGTIDPYVSLWGEKQCRYIKDSYNKPVVPSIALKEYNESRYLQSKSPKLIVASMTTCYEAMLDLEGEYLAGKSTTIVLAPKNVLLFLCAIINSKLASFWLNIIFNSLKMSGGAINIGKNELLLLPVPRYSKDFDVLVEQILEQKKESPSADTSALEAEIDRLVYELYGLTEEEIKIVEGQGK